MKKSYELSLVLPPMPSLRRVINQDSYCELQNALLAHMHQNPSLKSIGNQTCDNSTKWFESPPATLAEMVKLLRRMEKSGKWIRNLKN
jgi:hypothetical protein